MATSASDRGLMAPSPPTVDAETVDIDSVDRCHALLDLLLATVPEIESWWTARNEYWEEDEELTLHEAHWELVERLIKWPTHPTQWRRNPSGRWSRVTPAPSPGPAHRGRLLRVNTLWPGVLQVVEVAIQVADLLESDPARSDDAALVGAWATAGMVCDLTNELDWVNTLLPWMGPRTVKAASAEIK